jgi:VWFA-related protein
LSHVLYRLPGSPVKLRYSIAALGLACALTQHFAAQQAPAPTPGVIRINVNLVQVDAVVTDGSGKPVTNLKAEDFEVLQDGKVQKVRNFEFVRVKDTLGSMTVRPGSLLPVGGAPALPPTSSLKQDQIRRTIALVVDDIGLSQASTVLTRDAMRKWINNEMQPGDLVSVVRTNAAVGALQQFTSDKRLLNAAVDRLRFQPGRVGVDSLASFTALPLDGGPGPADVGFSSGAANAYLVGSINAVRYVMQGLRDLPGRKSLILFAEDMNLNSLDRQRMDIEERLRRLGDEANRSAVVIHTIDPRGVVSLGTTAADNLNGRDGVAIAETINARASAYISSQDGMVLLAQRTGGLFFAAGNDLVTPLRRAIDDGDGYYLLGYQPDDDTFAPKAGVAKYHAISVRLKRPGLRVRSRTGFFGLSDDVPSTSVPQTRQAQIAKALVSPFTTADLRVRLTTLFSNSEADGSYIKTLLHFDAHDLSFTEDADGARSVTVDIAVVAFNENGDPAETVNKTWSLRVAKDNYEDVLRKGLVYSVPVPIKKAGPYQLRVALRDATSRKLGSAMQFIEVPDVKSGRLALSGIVVTADPPAAADPEGTPALRIFKVGGAISYAYEVFNPPARANEKSPLEMQVRLYRDGEIVYEGMPLGLNTEHEKNAKRLLVGGRIQLTKIPAGDYVMQVIVADTVRRDKSRLAAQTIDFEVRP